MGEVFGQISVTQGGAAALVAVFVLLVFLGRLVPLRTLEARLKDKNEQLQAERDEKNTWRAVAERSETARLALQAQNGELLELARTAGHVLNALPTPTGVTASAPVDQAPVSP